MTENHFDQFFKDRLDQYASPVNSEVLEKVFREREKRKKRPLGKWWLLPLLLVLVSGGYLIYPHITSQSNNLQSSSVSGEKSHRESSEMNSSKNSSEEIAKKEINQEQQFSGIDATNQNAITKISPDKNSSSSTKNSTSQNFSNPGNSSSASPGKTILVSSSQGRDKKIHSLLTTSPGTEDEFGSFSNGYEQSKRPKSLLSSFKISLLDPSFGSWTDQFDPYRTSRESSVARGNHFPFCVPECNFPGCPSFKAPRRNDWYIEAFASIDFPSKKLGNQSSKSDFIQAKDSTEKMLPSYTAGFRISKNITNSWLIKTGLHYSRINERFDYRNENEKRLTTIITIRTIIRGPGDTIVVSDTSFIEQTGTHVKRTYNKYRNIDIPVILSYEVRNPGFTVGIQGGLLFNLRSWYTGDMLDTSMVPMSQTIRDPKAQFKSSMGVGIYAGVSFIKPVAENWDLFAEPWYRKYLQNHAVSNAPFTQTLSTWGLQLGVRYKINRGGQRE